LNKLNCKLLETKHGLSQLVVRATRQQNILDVFYTTTIPDLFTVKVMCSCMRSDHKAVLINCNDVNGYNNKSNVANDCNRVTVFDLNPNTLKRLSDVLLSYNWSAISIDLDTCSNNDQFSAIYSDFIKIINYLIHSAISSKLDSMSDRDPPFHYSSNKCFTSREK